MTAITRRLTRPLTIGIIILFGFAGTSNADHKHYKKGKSYDVQRYDNSHTNEGCVTYQVSAYGGDGGIRFMHNAGGWALVQGHGQQGKICKGGYVRVELSKRHPSTTVALTINGHTYAFNSGEPSHQYTNNWHRKYIDIPVTPEYVQAPAYHGNNHYGYSEGKRHYDNYARGYQYPRYIPRQHYQKHRHGYKQSYHSRLHKKYRRHINQHRYDHYY